MVQNVDILPFHYFSFLCEKHFLHIACFCQNAEAVRAAKTGKEQGSATERWEEASFKKPEMAGHAFEDRGTECPEGEGGPRKGRSFPSQS